MKTYDRIKVSNRLFRILLCTGLLFAGTSAPALSLAVWDFNGIDLDDLNPASRYELSAGSTTVGIAQAALRLGSGVTHSTGAGQYGFKVANTDAQTSLAGAIAKGHYIEFSLTAAAGTTLHLDSLTFNGQSAASGADNIALLSSVGGFSDGAAITTRSGIAGATGGFDTDASGFGNPVDLSMPAFQNIASIRFRLYGWNTSGSTGATYFRNLSGDDLVIHGTVNVPEPASYALLCGGLGLLVLVARRGIGAKSPYNLIDK